jgi:hypothetical protein
VRTGNAGARVLLDIPTSGNPQQIFEIRFRGRIGAPHEEGSDWDRTQAEGIREINETITRAISSDETWEPNQVRTAEGATQAIQLVSGNELGTVQTRADVISKRDLLATVTEYSSRRTHGKTHVWVEFAPDRSNGDSYPG